MSRIFAILLWFAIQLQEGVAQDPVTIKVVHNTSYPGNVLDFSKVSRHLQLRDKLNVVGSFNGPEVLRPLLNECFVHETTKYLYRVCPFANITQHEKSQYSLNILTSTFHTVLGVWEGHYGIGTAHKEANTDTSRELRLDSMLFRGGSECGEEKIRRKARVELRCLKHSSQLKRTTVITGVTETKKCVYNIQLESLWVCGLGPVYSHLDKQAQNEWNVLETLLATEYIDVPEYERHLTRLLYSFGIERSTGREFAEVFDKKEVHDSVKVINTLLKENEDLRTRIQELENEIERIKATTTVVPAGGGV